MKFLPLCMLQLLLSVSFLLEGLAEEEIECLDNNLNPDDEYTDEDYGGTSVVDAFLSKLETYTGLNDKESFPVTLDKCGGKRCVVNPNGSAIWKARMDLYTNNMMNGTHKKMTLDGCLCHSTDIADYRSCMAEVRTEMTTQLDTILIATFKTILEENCNTLAVDCVAE